MKDRDIKWIINHCKEKIDEIETQIFLLQSELEGYNALLKKMKTDDEDEE